jgi:hypothetical protein
MRRLAVLSGRQRTWAVGHFHDAACPGYWCAAGFA